MRKFVHKWKIIHPSRSTPRSDRAMLRETAINPRATSQTPQASVSMLNVKVHDSRIRKTLNKGWKGCRRKSLFFLKRTWQKAQFRFAKLHLIGHSAQQQWFCKLLNHRCAQFFINFGLVFVK